MSSLNIFELSDLPSADHDENRLTNAFLSLISLEPMAMAEFLDQVRDLLPDAGYSGEALLPRLSQLDEPVDVVSQEGREAVDPERAWLVSVLMTDDELPIEEGLQPREGGAIYDGVVTAGNHVVTLENKLHKEAVRMDQLNPDLPGDRTIRWPDGARAVVLPWKDMIQAMVNLRDGDYLSPTSAGLIGDFQAYLLDHFEYLNPYPHFSACHGRSLLLRWRCVQILRSLAGVESVNEGSASRYPALELPGSKAPAGELFLHPSSESGAARVNLIRASLHPGVKADQARALYGSDSVDRDAITGLDGEDERWTVKASLQWRYQATYLGSSTTPLDVPSYVDYWVAHQELIGQHRGRQAMRSVMDRLHEDGLLTGDKINEVEEAVFTKNYDHLNIYPSVSLLTSWPLEEAETLDDGKGSFERELRQRVQPVLELMGQSLPEAGQG